MIIKSLCQWILYPVFKIITGTKTLVASWEREPLLRITIRIDDKKD